MRRLPAGEAYQRCVDEAALAKRKALQLQEQSLQYMQQLHTALERGQPQRGVALEAEALRVRPGREEGLPAGGCAFGCHGCRLLVRQGQRARAASPKKIKLNACCARPLSGFTAGAAGAA